MLLIVVTSYSVMLLGLSDNNVSGSHWKWRREKNWSSRAWKSLNRIKNSSFRDEKFEILNRKSFKL